MARQACRELIPGIEGQPNIDVREGFWEINYLATVGWKVTQISGALGGTVIAVNPDGAEVSLSPGGLPAYPWAALVGTVEVLAHLDRALGLSLIKQLEALAAWLRDRGPITEPARYSTLSKAAQYGELAEARARLRAAGELPRHRNRKSSGLGRELLGERGSAPRFTVRREM